MAGVRIRHATEVAATFTLVDGSRPYREPWTCPPPPEGCATTHDFKTYHIRVDDTGAAIVSPEIWQRLQRIAGNPFSLVNEVAQPPAQRIVLPRLKFTSRLIAPGVRDG